MTAEALKKEKEFWSDLGSKILEQASNFKHHRSA